jgi:pSer/pThr/pTyr-binding forkhead associated (FHA) protein
LGGFIGGFTFDLVATLFAAPIQGMASAGTGGPQIIEIGGPSRAVGFTAIGALTGFFVGLVEELLKQAWVRVLVGRNEGKDFIISKPMTILGRDERADVPLFGDPALAPQHAAIRIDGNRHTILDGGTPPGTLVNGKAVAEALLKDGDMIQLGQVRLLFREKATASRVAAPRKDVSARSQSAGNLSVPGNLCQFCGAPRDPSGKCLCSVGGEAVPQLPDPVGGARPEHQPATPAVHAGRLVGLDGAYAGQAFALAGPVVRIGRETGREVLLSGDASVSRAHARIEEKGGAHVLIDEGSSNGTFVNGVRISVQALAPGDTVQIGAGSYRYE